MKRTKFYFKGLLTRCRVSLICWLAGRTIDIKFEKPYKGLIPEDKNNIMAMCFIAWCAENNWQLPLMPASRKTKPLFLRIPVAMAQGETTSDYEQMESDELYAVFLKSLK